MNIDYFSVSMRVRLLSGYTDRVDAKIYTNHSLDAVNIVYDRIMRNYFRVEEIQLIQLSMVVMFKS